VSSPSSVIQNTCYVIMPFSDSKSCSKEEWDNIFEKLFKPTFEHLGYQCSRSKASVGLVIKRILESIHSSEIIMADLTDAKPNVFYELGIAHAITNRTIMVTQDLSSVSSDLKPYGVIEYEPDTKEGYMKFGTDITEALRRLLSPKPPSGNPVIDFLGINIRFLEVILEKPVALLECAKCHRVYQVSLETMAKALAVDAGLRVDCGHYGSFIFKGLAGIS